ncbi:MAG TPA: ABC-2 family transporter protein [Acidimicrobiales bacterium]|nr:ABC-2 family transporter protein [Acidimicrobiales bacterium]
MKQATIVLASAGAPLLVGDDRAGPRPASWRTYAAMARAARRSVLNFALSFWLGIAMSVFLLLTTLYLWRTILAHAHNMGGWTWTTMRSYIAVTFVASTLVSMSAEWQMAGRILDGSVAIDLTRPVDYQLARLAESLGLGVAELATGVAISVLTVMAFGGLRLPPAYLWPAFLVSMAAVLPLKWTATYVVTLLCFWTHNYLGLSWARQAITALLSGAMIPLSLLPVWLKDPAQVLPFQGMASTPGLIFAGRLHGGSLVEGLVVQWAWVIGGLLLTRLAWSRASRRLTVHGG